MARMGRLSSWSDESGKIQIRTLISLALVVGMVYGAMKFLPVRASAYEFNDAIRDEVTFAGARRSSDETIRNNLIERANSLGLPIQSGNIRITRPGPKYIMVDVSYSVPIELVGGYVYDWKFDQHQEAPLIF